MNPFDNCPNPFIELDLSKEELVEAYNFFQGVDLESQMLVADALDAKYSLMELINIRRTISQNTVRSNYRNTTKTIHHE